MALVDDLDRALGELQVLLDAADTDYERRRQAAMYRDEVTAMKARLTATERRVTFIGPAGVGKTAALTALAGLYIGEAPTTPKELRERSVLPVGPGVTPAFPITVRAPGEGEAADRIGLVLTPMSERALRRMVEEVADYELFFRSAVARKDPSSEEWYLGRELRDVVLQMAGYAEGREIVVEDGVRRARVVRPLDAAMPGMDLAKLTAHLLGRCGFEARRRLRWEFPDTDEGRAALKALVARVSVGAEAEAAPPAEACLIWPGVAALGGEGARWVLEERVSVDPRLKGLQDRDQWFEHLDGLVVVCSTTSSPLSVEARIALNELTRHPVLGHTLSRLVFLMLDKDESRQFALDSGDREVWQLTQSEKRWERVKEEGLRGSLSLHQILVFDPLHDGASTLRNRLRFIVHQHTQKLTRDTTDLLDELSAFVLRSEGSEAALSQILALVGAELKRAPLVEPPWIEPADWVPEAVYRCPKHLQRAALRDEGGDERFAIVDVLELIARGDAHSHLAKLLSAIDTLKNRDDLRQHEDVLTHLRRAWARAIAQVAMDYGAAVRAEVEQLSRGAPVWREALAEFDRRGEDEPLRERIVGHFTRWAQLQPFTAHRSSTLAEHIPQLAKLQAPDEAPGFTLVAENLRRLKHLRWTLNGVNLLVGANGAGKTTTLTALRFFSQAMQEGGAELAAPMVLGVFPNLRTWGVGEAEPVCVALERGLTRWEFVFRHSESEGTHIRERLTHRGEEVYAVGERGTLIYRGLDLGAVRRETGLRHLMRLKKTDQPLHQMAALAESLRISFSTDLVGLMRDGGSRPLPARPLESRGQNAFSVLQRLKDAPGQADKYEFVLDGLKLAFPGLVESLGFEATEHQMRVFVTAPGGRPPNTIGNEAEGLVQLLVDLVAVASANPGDVIALDEPDSHLHPYAARVLLRRVEAWAHRHELTVIIATHSVVLLDEMKRSPERVFVMTPNDDGNVPNALTDLYNSDWLQSFELGELYKNDEIGSNVDDA
jgi:predicted ATPase